MWSYHGPIILFTRHDDGGLEERVSGACAVVSANEVVVGLAFDRLKSTEEDSGTKGVFEEAECPTGEYTLQTNGAQLVSGIVPHGLESAIQYV